MSNINDINDIPPNLVNIWSYSRINIDEKNSINIKNNIYNSVEKTKHTFLYYLLYIQSLFQDDTNSNNEYINNICNFFFLLFIKLKDKRI